MNFVYLSQYIKRIVPTIKEIIVHDSFVVVAIEKKDLLLVSQLLRDHNALKFESLLDIWGVDYPDLCKRFEVNYLFCSIVNNVRLIVKVTVEENESLDSMESLFPSAGWLEREVWDMFGIFFFNNSDLRRILTDYGFEGYPLRKDFPLSGFTEVRYDDGIKRVIQEPLETTQEYRLFNFKSPWEN